MNGTTVREALHSLAANPVRTLLMALGVCVGIAVLSVVVVTAQGTRAAVNAFARRLGLDLIMVRAGGDVQVFAPTADRGLTVLLPEDARAIEAQVPGIGALSVTQNQRGISVVAGDRSVTTRAFGVEPPWMWIRGWDVAEGAFLDDADMAAMSRVVILGHKVANRLFPEGGAAGHVVRIGNDPYQVKGVFIEMGVDAGGDDWDDRIVVPYTTSARRLFNRPYLEQIVMTVDDPRRLPQTAELVRAVLRVQHGIGPGEPDDFFVREPRDVEHASLRTSSTLEALLLAVAVIALLAGGTIIMNLMLSAVSQREHEIGVRRATGALASDIARQFLLESVFVTLAGGVGGVVLGLAAAMVIGGLDLAPIRVTWLPFALAAFACVAIGVLFGVQPARAAARVDPATLLREHRM